MQEYLIGGIIGAIIGYIISNFFDGIKSYTKKHLKNKKRKKDTGELSVLTFTENFGYLPIDHSIPMYKEENIILRNKKSHFIIEIPEDYKERLSELNFKFNSASKNNFEHKVKEVFDFLEIENYLSVIKQASEVVAQKFLNDLESGLPRFNGELFGVENLKINRLTENEDSSLDISFYVTDYFTFRVFSEIYNNNKHLFKPNNVVYLNKITPFLCSFGLGTFVIANNGMCDCIILARRSDNVVVDQNRIHFSMNEAFSMLDLDEFKNPSFISCLFRGLKEELGIDEKYRTKITDYGFLDLGIDINRMEMGISSFARIEFDSKFTPALLKELYSIAQDGELETNELMLVPLNKLTEFIQNNENKMSSSCRATLKAFDIRYKNGYIPLEK